MFQSEGFLCSFDFFIHFNENSGTCQVWCKVAIMRKHFCQGTNDFSGVT